MGTVCQTCGDEGFVEAFVYCDSCKIGAVHRYCCGITPVPIDDYVTWFCSECEGSDTGFDCKEVDQVGILTKSEKQKKNKKKKKKRSNHTPPVLKLEYHEFQDSSNVESVEVTSAPPIMETMEEPERREVSGSIKSNELTGLVGNEASISEKSEKGKKKKMKKKKRKSINHYLPDATNVEPVEASKKREDSDTGKSHELAGLVSNELSVLEKSKKKKKKKKRNEETTSVEATKESKKRKNSYCRESEELNVLVREEVLVFKKSEKKKKRKKKKKTNKEEEKKGEERSNHTSPFLDVEDHCLQHATNVEPMKESKKQKTLDNRNSDELNGLARNEVSVLEKSEKKKKKKKKKKKNKNKEEEKNNEESSNHTLPFLYVEDHGLQDGTITEPMKEFKKQKTSDSRNSNELNGLVRNEVTVLEKSEKKKETNKEKEESSNHTWPVLAVEDNGVQDTNNVEPAKAQESSASGKPHELVGLAKYAASVSEGGNSSTVPDHNSCTTSKKRRLSSGNIRVTSENTELATGNISCKEAESNMPQTNEVLTATDSPVLNNDRALPIFRPIWRGSISVKQGNICSIDRLVAHLSSLACHKVHEKASSLHTRLSAEMFPRLEIWPESFLKNGPPTDESIALYFFPSRDSKDEKVYYSLVHEMKKDDLAMRCVLDNVELLLFTSYQLPMDCWRFHSKEYLWGIFRRRTSQH